MSTHADKTQKNKNRAVADNLPKQQSARESTFRVTDNGEAIAQRKLQDLINNSPRVQQLKVHQEILNNSPQVKQLKLQQAIHGSYATEVAQRSETSEGNTLQSELKTVQKKNNKTGLPDNLKSGIENLSGISMNDVKVHYNSAKPAQLQAHAYAQGANIHLASGQEKHLPHEAWHVVQQKQGRVKATTQLKSGVNINDDRGLEKEADVMGENALQAGRPDIQDSSVQLQRMHALDAPAQLCASVFQLEITDSGIKEQVRAEFNESEASPDVLNKLLEDAFKDTNTFEEAVHQIKYALKKHDEAASSALSTESSAVGSSTRPEIDIDSIRPKFQSSVPKTTATEAQVFAKWRGLQGTQGFYSALRKSLKIARDTKHKKKDAEAQNLDELIDGYRTYPAIKTLIDNYVRVRAVKAKGASSGTGLDELFKTSETMKFLELSYRPQHGKSPTALFKGQKFDWIDAQQQLRLSTELIVWAGDLVGEISGHTGTFHEEYRSKWMTAKQALMHQVRDAAISARSNPATAIVEAIATHLRVTVNVQDFESKIYKGAQAKLALTAAGHKVAEVHANLSAELERHRDMLKSYLAFFREHATTPRDSSPMRGRLGGNVYHDESPMRSRPGENSVKENVGQVPDNPLPNLAVQSRMNHRYLPVPIPEEPGKKKAASGVDAGVKKPRFQAPLRRRPGKSEETEDVGQAPGNGVRSLDTQSRMSNRYSSAQSPEAVRKRKTTSNVNVGEKKSKIDGAS
ncbi:MAG: DUF4157 domain-containing protein [Pseudomonadota bacterium]